MEEKPEIEKVNEQNNNEQLNNSNQNNQNEEIRKEDTSKNQEKPKKKSFKIILAILLPIIIICVLTAIIVQMLIKQTEQNRWKELFTLANCLPELPVRPTEIKEYITSSSSSLEINLNNLDKQNYDKILEKVKQKYPLDNKDFGIMYEAYDSNGTKITLKPTFYPVKFDTVKIEIKKLLYKGAIKWPTSGIASTIPRPTSTRGIISIDQDEFFLAYMQDMTKEDLKNYFEQCKQYGYNLNITSLDQTFYESKNQNGDILSLQYDGGNVVSITVEQGRKKSQFSELSNSQSNDNQESNNEDAKVKQEFQKTMKEVEQRLKQQK